MTYDVYMVLPDHLKRYTQPLFQQRAQLNELSFETASGALAELFAARNYKMMRSIVI